MTRVYLAATLPTLARWQSRGAAEAGGPAYAVTDAVRAVVGPDEDELDQAVRELAAEAATQLLAAEQGGPGRRVVLVADAGNVTALDGAEVDVGDAVPRRSWACAFVDADPTGRSNDEAADAGLGWYAVQEIPQLLADAGLTGSGPSTG